MTSAGYGNTANPTQTLTLARTYSYDAANRLSNWSYAANIYTSSFPIQTDTYTYDNNGNRLTKQAVLTGESSTPQQTTYSYDFENRLNQLQYVNIPNITGTQTDNLVYNGEGLRTQAVLNSVAANYSYDGMNILVERDGSGNTTKSYTRGLDFGGGIGSIINQNYTNSGTAVTQYYDYNDLGSVADTTTSTGTAVSDYTYDAFGNLLTPQSSGDTNRYLFSTKEFDSRSGLDYFGLRYYDPEIGRWLTPDPLGMVDGPDTYLYVGENPINQVDPYGLQLLKPPYQYPTQIPVQMPVKNPIQTPIQTPIQAPIQTPIQTPVPSPTPAPVPQPIPQQPPQSSNNCSESNNPTSGGKIMCYIDDTYTDSQGRLICGYYCEDGSYYEEVAEDGKCEGAVEKGR